MDPVLGTLIRYQELSLELSRLKGLLDQYPSRLKEIDDEVEKASAALAASRSAVTDHQKDRRRLDAELQDLEAKLRKYNEQLMQVKTNTEYKAMQAEIAGVKEKVGAVEEKILLLMDESENAERRVKEEERSHEVRKKDAESRKNTVRQEESALRQEASRVEAALQAARAGIGTDVLDLFNRLAPVRNGIAVARARDERCQGCNVRLRPQVYQEIKRNDRIIQCDSCMRILFHVAEPPAPDGNPPAEPASTEGAPTGPDGAPSAGGSGA